MRNSHVMRLIKTIFFLAVYTLTSSAFAVTASVSSLSVISGSSQSITLSNINGQLSVRNSSPGLIIVSAIDASHYKVTGVAVGSATITFKDLASSVQVRVSVKAPVSSVLEGRLLASNCFQCHGTNGSGGFERLTGESSGEIYDELRKFSTGTEEPNGIMAAHAMGFSDAQLKAIAAYLSTLR